MAVYWKAVCFKTFKPDTFYMHIFSSRGRIQRKSSLLFGYCYYSMKDYCSEQLKYQMWHQLTSSFSCVASIKKILSVRIRKLYKIHVNKLICFQALKCHHKI